MAFNNSILSGTTLVRTAMKSEGYAAGSAGWQIERDGSAEFNDLIVRGTFESSDPNSDAKIVITESSVEYYDNNGNFVAETEYVNGAGVAYNVVGVGGYVVVEGGLSKTTPGYMYHINDDGTSLTVSTHRLLSLQNGWVHRSGFLQPHAKLTPDGTVMFSGTVDSGTNSDGTVMGTVPPGLEPNANVSFSPGTYSGAGRIQINTSGNMVLWGITSGSIFLDGCSYALDL